jgi:hypothetical protein
MTSRCCLRVIFLIAFLMIVLVMYMMLESIDTDRHTYEVRHNLFNRFNYVLYMNVFHSHVIFKDRRINEQFDRLEQSIRELDQALKNTNEQ